MDIVDETSENDIMAAKLVEETGVVKQTKLQPAENARKVEENKNAPTHPIIILVQILRHHRLMPRQRVLQGRIRVTGDPERGRLDIVWIFVEPGVIARRTHEGGIEKVI